MLERSVIGSAGNQPAACIAARTSSLLPIKPTLSGSPGMSLPVRVTIGSEARPGSCSMAPERRQRKIREREIGDEHAGSNHQPSPVASHPDRPFLRDAFFRGIV